MAQISAHRAGGDTRPGETVEPNSLDAIAAAVELGADLVEIDVHQHAGAARLGHDQVDDTSPALAEALAALGDRAALHLDLKCADPDAVIVGQAVAALGAGRVVVTTNLDADVRRLKAWAVEHAPGLLVGLSTSAPPPGHGLRARLVSWFPRTRMRRSGTDLVVSHHVLARWWLARWAHRRGLPLLVWTVDDDRDLIRWLRDPRTTIVTTNRPARALDLRSRVTRCP